ncbi:MAG: hypothetical protein QXP34_02650 [Candidatus Aenigmatarchaeota archaeon]
MYSKKIDKSHLFQVLLVTFFVAVLNFLIFYFRPIFFNSFISRLEKFYSNQTINTLEEYNLLNKYGISLKDLDYNLCLYMIESNNINIPFIEFLSKDSREMAIYHVCSQILYYSIENTIEKVKKSFGEIEDEKIRSCVVKYILENKDSWIELREGALIKCLIN